MQDFSAENMNLFYQIGEKVLNYQLRTISPHYDFYSFCLLVLVTAIMSPCRFIVQKYRTGKETLPKRLLFLEYALSMRFTVLRRLHRSLIPMQFVSGLYVLCVRTKKE